MFHRCHVLVTCTVGGALPLIPDVTLPAQVAKADFNNDPFLRTFDISVDTRMMEVKGRVLPVPKLLYGGRV